MRLKDMGGVRFDDRLLTVLNQPAGDRHDVAVRWRQLVDLVARAGPGGSGPVVAQALESIRSQASEVDENLRAAAARAVAGRPLPIGLLEYFAADQLSVSAPVLAAATLDPGQWGALLTAADEETRNFVQTLHPEVGAIAIDAASEASVAETAARESLQPQMEAVAAALAGAEAPAPPRATPSIQDVVARIERRRRKRETQRPGVAGVEAAMPAGSPALFRWECGPNGEIAWVEGAPRGALIGRTIARVQEDDGDRVDEEVVRAFGMRAPFRDAALTVSGDGLLAGQWKISGIPAFEPTDGRFAGYRGIALREVSSPAAPAEGIPDILGDPDSLRELVHEIKTPLTAIIGFAEIIEGQYLGPADHRYRQRAGEIVAQARMLLRAIDDLDFAAKVHSSASEADRRADLMMLVEQTVASLREAAAGKDVRIDVASPPVGAIAAVEPELAERLLTRLANALLDRADGGEQLRIAIDAAGGQCRVFISRPAALRNLTDAELFDSGVTNGQALSIGFALRLVRGLARIAGGDLVATPADFSLLFPRA